VVKYNFPKKKKPPKEKQNWRKRVSIDLFYRWQLGRNRGERWKWSKKIFIWKLRWKRNGRSRWKVEQSEIVGFKKI